LKKKLFIFYKTYFYRFNIFIYVNNHRFSVGNARKGRKDQSVSIFWCLCSWMLPRDLHLWISEDSSFDSQRFRAQISRNLAGLFLRKTAMIVGNGDADAFRRSFDIVDDESDADRVDHILIKTFESCLSHPFVRQEGRRFGEALWSVRRILDFY
jgi:hypothetical protein